MRSTTLRLFVAALGLTSVAALQAAEMYPWREHQQPYGYLFGNEIDGHQQSRQRADGSLDGYLYIQTTGVVTQDKLPVATHADCSSAGGGCIVGWRIDGKPSRATRVHAPMHDHPVFLLHRAGIPQPGAYTHFHWTGPMLTANQEASGYLLQLTAVNRFCFIHHGADAAVETMSCRDNGGIPVDRGVDVATHLNIVTGVHSGM